MAAINPILFLGRNQASLEFVEPALRVDADPASDKRAGVPDSVGIGGVVIAADDRDFHEGTVAGAGVSRQGRGVRGWAGRQMLLVAEE